MKESSMLTIMSLFSLLLLTFHLTGDIVYGWERGGLANLIGVVIISSVWLSGALLFRERLPGRIIILLGALISLLVPYVHMSGAKGVGIASRLSGHQGHFFFVWSLLALGVMGLFSIILSLREMWSLRGRKKQAH
jgi:hypothetical protein